MTDFRGVIPPVVVAEHEDGTFDVQSYQRGLDRMIQAGVHGVFALGSSGEGAFATPSRREEILRATNEVVAGRVPVLAGVIDTQTDRVLEHVRQAEQIGVDGIVATAPFYALGGMAQVENHFRAIAAATELPLFAYDIPVCVHVKLPPALLMRLGQDGVLAGVKDSSGDDVSFRFLLQDNERAGHPLSLLTGHEVVVDGAYLGGADGSVPGLANVDPAGYVRQWNAYQAGDWETVRKEQDRLSDLMRIVMVPSSTTGFGAGVGAFKTALKVLGIFESNQMPTPVSQLTAEEEEGIAQVLRHVGLLG
ncbi:dihydrodipicolinate synthase family protein [Arcanobacterium pinnipediorum]|uniref:Dihydrodipicolinate synthase family protein n=2 Tax=Arcanobacterium pinnipediorum TaxID=1503041 RepID=A0ABY5AEX4_9ACTO|nr:dihydrodipicolinate synthase family protein [Arcanobacterium pinnipediorum]USR78725.1 dihydrodipicolinate synthase family protein [Arcanobacterium pinnipediorum]